MAVPKKQNKISNSEKDENTEARSVFFDLLLILYLLIPI